MLLTLNWRWTNICQTGYTGRCAQSRPEGHNLPEAALDLQVMEGRVVQGPPPRSRAVKGILPTHNYLRAVRLIPAALGGGHGKPPSCQLWVAHYVGVTPFHPDSLDKQPSLPGQEGH